MKWSGVECAFRKPRWTRDAPNIHLTALSTVLIFFLSQHPLHQLTISGFLKMTPRRERVHRATESSPAVDDGVDVRRSPASIPPGRNVDRTPGSQHSASSTFGCDQCSKVFNRRENLSRHLKTRKSSNLNFRRLKCLSTSISSLSYRDVLKSKLSNRNRSNCLSE